MKRKLLVSAMMILSLGVLTAQNLVPVPMDTAVRYGKLANGLTYYVRHNAEPRERAEFYIVQNVGAILEEDSQNGLAHFLEHMAFNGTENFPGKGVIRFLERNGVKFGENINAYTSLDETVYNLSNVPVTKPGVIDSSLLVLHDWSNCISLLPDEIDSERGVIREEWRQGASADRRMWKESNKQKYPGSQYAKRDVIGDTAVINNFDYQTLRDYYKKWYRPDQQAIIVVGDIDAVKMEQQIKDLFSPVQMPENPAERVVYQIENNAEPIVSIVKDPEGRMTRLGVEFKKDKLPEELELSVQGYVLNLVKGVISSVLAERINDYSQKADAAYIGGYANYGELVKSKDGFEMLVIPKEGKELEGMKAMFMDLEKMRRFGFTSAEVERAKTNMLKGYEKAFNERNSKKNNSYVREYVGNFLHNEVIPGIEWEYNQAKMILPMLKTEQINQIAKSFVTDDNMIIYIMAPDKEGVNLPEKPAILSTLAAVKAMEIEPMKEEVMDKPLLDNCPAPGKIIKTVKDKNLGITIWTLSNGAKVVIKPTDFKDDEILMTAYSEGGLSMVSDLNDLPSANFAENVVEQNGLGQYSATDLSKVLTGKIASSSPYISDFEEGLRGSSSVADLETMLQLAYLNFTGSRKDNDAFQAMINMYETILANSAKDPKRTFSDSINLFLSGHSPRTILLSKETIAKVDQDKSLKIFRERFSSPADFTFVLVGKINSDDQEVQHFVTSFIGGINSDNKSEKYIDRGVRTPKGKVNNYFKKEMQVKKATNYVMYSGDMKYSMENGIIMQIVGDLLRLRYTETIREKEGGTYGVSVSGSIAKDPVNKGSVYMYYDTDPEKQTKLIKLIHAEMDTLVSKGPRVDELDKVKQNMLKKYDENLRENTWWQSVIKSYLKNGFNYPKDYQKTVNGITASKIQKAVAKLVEQGNVLEVVMMPE